MNIKTIRSSRVSFVVQMHQLILTFVIFCCSLNSGFLQKPYKNKLSGIHREANTLELQNELLDALTQKLLGHYEESRILLLRFTQNNPQIADGFFRLAEVNRLTGREVESLRAAREASRLDEHNKFYRQFLAELLSSLKLFKEAVSEYETLIRLHPFESEYYESLAEVFLSLGRSQDAIKTLERLESIRGESEAILLRIYDIHMRDMRFKEALRTAESMIKLSAGKTEHYSLAIEACLGLDNESCALEKLDQIRIKNIEILNNKIFLTLATYYMRKKNYPQALDYLEKAFSIAGQNLDTQMHILLGLIENKELQENYKKSLEQLALKLVQSYPGEAKVFSALGDFYLTQKKNLDALKFYKEAALLDPSRYAIWRQILYLNLEAGKFKETLTLADSLEELFPLQLETFLLKALAQGRAGKFQEGISTLNHAEFLTGDNPTGRARWLSVIGEIKIRAGNIGQAEKIFEEARILDNQGVTQNIWGIYLMCLRQNYTDNFKESINELRLKSEIPLAKAVCAYCLTTMKETKEAKIMLDELEYGNYFLGPHVLDLMGAVARLLGFPERAKQLTHKAILMSPEYKIVLREQSY